MTLWEVFKNEEVRNLCTEDMDSTAKLLSLQDFPTFIEIKTILVRNLPVSLFKDGESVVKADEVLSDGEIILFTTKEHLKILARAHQILEDG